jgi:hypothetical protein
VVEVEPLGAGYADRAKIEAGARLDGIFVQRTNTKLCALQVELRYRNLLAVEDAFKTPNALMATRTIFHKTDAGIHGHVFCTFLALVLRTELMDCLAARKTKRLEWQRIFDDLAELSEIEVEQAGKRALLRTRPEHRSRLPRPRHYLATGLPRGAASLIKTQKLWCLKLQMVS